MREKNVAYGNTAINMALVEGNPIPSQYRNNIGDVVDNKSSGYNSGLEEMFQDQSLPQYANDNLNHEAQYMDQLVRDYITSENGKAFLDYAASKGKKFIDIKGVGAANLDDRAVAAVIHDGLEGILVSNYSGRSFDSRITEMSEQYGISEDAAKEYVLTHEFAHIAGYTSEAETEGFIKDYFATRASQSIDAEEKQKYDVLADMAYRREMEQQKLAA